MDNNMLFWAVQAIVTAFGVVLWSAFNEMKKKGDKTAEDLANYKVQAAERFLTKLELRDAMESLNKAFEQHASRIDNRLDKLEERILRMTEGRHNGE